MKSILSKSLVAVLSASIASFVPGAVAQPRNNGSVAFCEGLAPGRYCNPADTLNIVECPEGETKPCPANRFCATIGRVSRCYNCERAFDVEEFCDKKGDGTFCAPDFTGSNGVWSCPDGKEVYCAAGSKCKQINRNTAICLQNRRHDSDDSDDCHTRTSSSSSCTRTSSSCTSSRTSTSTNTHTSTHCSTTSTRTWTHTHSRQHSTSTSMTIQGVEADERHRTHTHTRWTHRPLTRSVSCANPPSTTVTGTQTFTSVSTAFTSSTPLVTTRIHGTVTASSLSRSTVTQASLIVVITETVTFTSLLVSSTSTTATTTYTSFSTFTTGASLPTICSPGADISITFTDGSGESISYCLSPIIDADCVGSSTNNLDQAYCTSYDLGDSP